MATAQTDTSLGSYIPHILSADWWKRYLTGNVATWYLPAAGFLLGYLFLFLIGVVANVLGFRGFNWVTGFVVQMVVLVVSASWMHFLAAGGIGFIAGQAGGTAGLSVADGQAKAWAWMEKVGRFILHLALNAPVAFYAIAIWPVKDAPFFAFIVLASSISIAIAVPLIFKEGKFWTWLLWYIHLAIVLGGIVFFTTKAVAPEQSKRLGSWVEAKFYVNKADRASDAADAKIRQDAIDKADTCFQALTPQSTRYQRELCESLRRNAGHLINEDDIDVASYAAMQRLYAAGSAKAKKCYQDLPDDATRAAKEECDALRDAARKVLRDPAPAPKRVLTNAEAASSPQGTVAESARSTPVVAAAWNCQPWKEVDYTPSQQPGAVELGVLTAGHRYEFVVSGKIWQTFTEPDATGKPVPQQTCEMDPEGRVSTCNNPDGSFRGFHNGRVQETGPNRDGVWPVLIPGEGYGKFVIHAWGKALSIGSSGAIQSKDDLPVMMDVNDYQTSESYTGPSPYAGKGTLRVQIKQCTQT